MALITGQVKLTPTATGSAPSGTEGSMYYDSDADTLKQYGTAWSAVNPNKALGSGGIETTYSGYKVHTFRSTGNFVVAGAAVVCDILIIAGGGGTSDMSGGGGAGGYQYLTSQTVAVGSHTVTVGAGGTRAKVDSGAHGGKGGDSQFASLTASKGGGGAGYEGTNGQTGGSGGGASYSNHGGGAVEVAGQGYAGGGYSGSTTGNMSGGGGGGASQAGTGGGTAHNGGDGGDGIQNNIDGNNYYWSGGGGGHCYESSTNRRGGDGGKGGGGGGNVTFGHGRAGWGDQNGIEDAKDGVSENTYMTCTGHGARNTGGGGGGGTNGGTVPPNRWGSNGGSGCVIIRYVN